MEPNLPPIPPKPEKVPITELYPGIGMSTGPEKVRKKTSIGALIGIIIIVIILIIGGLYVWGAILERKDHSETEQSRIDTIIAELETIDSQLAAPWPDYLKDFENIENLQ